MEILAGCASEMISEVDVTVTDTHIAPVAENLVSQALSTSSVEVTLAAFTPSLAATAICSGGFFETISTPATPTGETMAITGISYTYSSNGSASSAGHVLQYNFDFGDGTSSGWQDAPSFQKTWTNSGTYQLTVQARCQLHSVILSSVSAPLAVTVSLTTYTLIYTAGTGGSITGTSPQTVGSGASGSAVLASPNTGYHFVNWSDGVLTASRTDTNVTANVSRTAYFAINTYTISGRITLNGSVLPGVTLQGLPGNPVTDAGGNYSAAVSHGWTGTISPTLAGYVFSPPSTLYAGISADRGQDYMAFIVPPIPSLISPANGASGVTAVPATLSWAPSSGADSYHLQVATGSDFSVSTLVVNAGLSQTSLQPNLQLGTTYYWRVNATNPIAGTSDWSSIWSFTTIKANTSTTLTSSNLNSTYGNPVLLTGIVSPSSATGFVTFREGAATLKTVGLSNGQAVFNLSSLTAGTHLITAEYSGDSTYQGSSSPSIGQTVNKATPVLTWANPADISYGTALGSAQLNASASVPGIFSYSPTTGTLLTVANGQTLLVNFLPTDTANYTNASAHVAINILRATVTVILSNLTQTYDGTPKAVTATTNPPGLSGLSITYNGSPLPPTNAGTYAVTASLADAHYQANPASGLLLINKGDQTIRFDPLTDKIDGGPPFSVTATTTAGLPVSFSIVSGPASITGNRVTLSGEGRVTVRASQSGDANWNAALPVDRSFTVNPATVTISASAGPNGSIDPSGPVAVGFGNDQSFSLTPAAGYHVSEVRIDGVSSGPVTTYTFQAVTAPHSIEAFFSNEFNITVSKEGDGQCLISSDPEGLICGEVCSKDFAPGSRVIINFIPESGSILADVTVDGYSYGPVPSITFGSIMDSHQVVAVVHSLTPIVNLNQKVFLPIIVRPGN